MIAGNPTNAVVIRAGLALAKAISKRSDLELYPPDKPRTTVMGTNSAVRSVYAALFCRSPVELTYTAGLPADIVTPLHTAPGKR